MAISLKEFRSKIEKTEPQIKIVGKPISLERVRAELANKPAPILPKYDNKEEKKEKSIIEKILTPTTIKPTFSNKTIENLNSPDKGSKSDELIKNLGYRTGKDLMQVGDALAFNNRQNDLTYNNADNKLYNVIKNVTGNDEYLKRNQQEIDTIKNTPISSTWTQGLQKAEEESLYKLKDGQNAFNNAVTDVLLAGGDMAIKAGASMATGLPLPYFIGLSSYADALQNDINKGVDDSKASLRAIGSGLISGGVESLTGIGASGASKALASKAGQKLLSLVPKNIANYLSKASNSVVGGIIKNAFGEGAEEAIEYDAQRIYQNLVLDENTPRDIKEQAYSALIGGVVGGVFGGGKSFKNNSKPSLPRYQKQTPTLPYNNANNVPNSTTNNVASVFNQESTEQGLKSKLEPSLPILQKQTPSLSIMQKKTPILPNMEIKTEQFITPKTSLNNVDINNGNINNQTDNKQVLKSILETSNNVEENQINNANKIKSIEQLYKDKKVLQATYDNAVKNGSLSDTENYYLDGLIKGTITFDQLPSNVRQANIQALYEVKKPLNDINKEIDNSKKQAKKSYKDLARQYVDSFDKAKDKPMGFLYQRETMPRNIRDIFKGDQDAAEQINDAYFTPVNINEAMSNNTKNEYRNNIKALNINNKPMYKVVIETTEQGLPKLDKVSESALVQLLGEGKITEDAVKSSGADVVKIKNAVQTFRNIYNNLITQANEVLIRNGYAPIEYRQDYFPHFQENSNDNLLGKIAKKLGFNVNTAELPTDIAGLTHQFRPGKKWVANFLRRTGNKTEYNALEGFDRYIEGVADVIHHTDDIQRLRALENEIRYKYSDEGIKAEVDKVNALEDISEEDRQSRINELFNTNKSKFSHLVTELRSYTDSLAGKKNINDRSMEHRLGRGMYEIAKAMENRVASNMVGLNPGSWITNFIPLTQALGGVKITNLLNAMKDTVSSTFKSDGLSDNSIFLTNRKGSEPLVSTGIEKISKTLASPMQMIDNFTSETLVRARYYENMRNGMNETEAMQDADKWTAGVMADRSKGALPTIFNETNPVIKLFTMFQVEVNNQLGFYFKDVPRDLKEKGIATMASAFLKMFLGAFLYNELYKKITGRRAAFDPIDIIKSAYGDFTDDEKTTYQAIENTAKNIGQTLPFVSGLVDGGRVPISSAIPNLPNLANAATGLATGEMNNKKALSVIGKELAKPAAYTLLPFGGGQLKKIGETVDTLSKGGSYGVDSKGNDLLQFAVEPTLPNLIKGSVFGKYSLPGAKEYVDSGFKSLSASVTDKYKKARNAGLTHEEFITALKAYNSAESNKDNKGNTVYLSKSKNQVSAIKQALPSFTKLKLEYLYNLFEISDKAWK